MASGEHAGELAAQLHDAAGPTRTIARATSGASEVSGRSVETPDDVLKVFEARRAHSYALGLAALCMVAFVLVLWLGGDPLGQRIHGTALVIAAVIGVCYLRYSRDVTRWKL